MMSRTISKGNILMTVGLLLMVAALALAVFNVWDSNRAGKASEEVLVELEDEILANKKSDFDMAMLLGVDKEMATILINGNEYIGVIEIPDLGISLPVLKTINNDFLRIAPCRYTGTYYRDSLVIGAHNYPKHFSPIRGINPGVDVYFTTVEGYVIHYVTSDRKETLLPHQVKDLVTTDGEWDLSLFTCTPGGRSRCVVRCVRM